MFYYIYGGRKCNIVTLDLMVRGVDGKGRGGGAHLAAGSGPTSAGQS